MGIVNAYAETQNCREREQGFREVLLGDSRVKGIYAVNVSTDALEARLAAEKLLREHPEINVLIGFNEPLAVGVAQAVDSLGLTGQVHAVSFDSNVNCIELLQTGAVAALVVQNSYAMGYLGVEKAWQVLQGENSIPRRSSTPRPPSSPKKICLPWRARRPCFLSVDRRTCNFYRFLGLFAQKTRCVFGGGKIFEKIREEK